MGKFASIVVAFIALFTGAAMAEQQPSVNDTARVLAGLPPSDSSPLAWVKNDASWKMHARIFDDAWKGLDQRQLSKIRTWSGKNLANPSSTLFYMFSGPDYLYADAFFPRASTYIMAGLEPPGVVPDFSGKNRGQLAGGLGELRNSLNSVLNYSFFRTKDMNVELRSGRMVGTIPILLTFLARAGKTINDVELIDLQPDGTVVPTAAKAWNATPAKGVRISFSDNVGKSKLYFFSTDVSENGVKKSGFLEFCSKFGKGDAFIKSASYLMHNDSFTTVRSFLLDHATALLQDDSGVPVRFLAKGWELRPYGAYVGPIPLFAAQTQASLYRLFSKDRSGAMDFGVGYQYRPTRSNLLLAIRDDKASTEQILNLPAKPSRLSPTSASADEAPAQNAVKPVQRKIPRAVRKNAAPKTKTVSNPYPKMFGYQQ